MKIGYTDRPILNLNEDLLTLKTVYMRSQENKEVFMNIRELVRKAAQEKYPNNKYVKEG